MGNSRQVYITSTTFGSNVTLYQFISWDTSVKEREEELITTRKYLTKIPTIMYLDIYETVSPFFNQVLKETRWTDTLVFVQRSSDHKNRYFVFSILQRSYSPILH